MNKHPGGGLQKRLITRTGLPAWAEPLATPARFIWVMYRRLKRDKAFLRAAGMAYATLVALVPLLMLLFGALDAVGVLERNPEAIEALVFGSFLGDIPEVKAFLVPGLLAVDLGTMGLVGIGGLLVVAMRLYIQVEDAFNEIFGFENDRRLYMRLLAFYASATVMPVLVISTFLRTWEVSTGVGLWWGGQLVIALVQLGLLLGAIKGFPAQRVPWRAAIAGALTSLVLLEVASFGFREYLVLFAADDPVRVIYGSVGVLPVFLLWLYLAWLMVMVGVEVAAIGMNYRTMFEAEYAEAYMELTAKVMPGPESVLVVMVELAEGFLAGKGAMSREDLVARSGMRAVDISPVVRAMEIAGLVARADASWLLTRPPELISLRELIDAWRRSTTAHGTDDARVHAVRTALDLGLDGSLADAVARWKGVEKRDAATIVPPGG